jgi:hypothetical protein
LAHVRGLDQTKDGIMIWMRSSKDAFGGLIICLVSIAVAIALIVLSNGGS